MTTADSIDRQLALARRELLDLSSSNRLLNTKRNTMTGAAIEVKEENSGAIFQILVHEAKSMRFEEGELADADEPPETVSTDGTKPAGFKRRRAKKRVAASAIPVDLHDDVLHTLLDPNELDRRLNRLYTDRNAIMQEQGVNVLYLALGFLRWNEPDFPGLDRHAPLLLIPVKLERARSGSRYSLLFDPTQEIITNFTLTTRLMSDFGIALPEISDELEDLDPDDYFGKVESAIQSQPSWQVQRDDIVLWFFSFSKLLMYRDLDPANWPETAPLDQRPLIQQLLRDGFRPAEPLIDDASDIDSLFDPRETRHVVDCDSSQALVIEEAIRQRSLVIQGPPGTGKSQTITNLIAAAAAEGQTILFVAEKMAALEVVKRRLDNIGLGDMVLELHSHKTNKRAVLQEMDRTLSQGTPQLPKNANEVLDGLCQRRDELNNYLVTLHSMLEIRSAEINGEGQGTGPKLYDVLTELIDLRSRQIPLPDFHLDEAAQWDNERFQQKLAAVAQLAGVVKDIGDPRRHPWRGATGAGILPFDLERALKTAPACIQALNEVVESARKLSNRFSVNEIFTLRDAQALINSVDALLAAPALDETAYGNLVWSENRSAISELATHAQNILVAKEKLAGQVVDAVWDRNVGEDMSAYRQYGQKWLRMFYASYRKARQTLKNSLVGKQPDSFIDRLQIFELLDRRRTGIQRLSEATVLGERAFGRFWLGVQSDWQKITAWESWDKTCFERGVHTQFRTLRKQLDDATAFRSLADDLKSKLARFSQNFKTLCDALKIDLYTAYDHWALDDTSDESEKLLGVLGNALLAPVDEVKSRLEAWINRPEALQQWQTYRQAYSEVIPIQNGLIATQISDGKLPPEHASEIFRFARAEALLREIYRQHPELESFDGRLFEKRVDEFCKYDVERIELARAEIAQAHWNQIGQTDDPNLPAAVALLRREMQKKARHLPLRKLLRQAGSAVQSVKPVFMMSPISVAQYLEPGGLEFDILLIDEASQVRPVEALGAAARCRQIIVVGDDKQMPPTQFFGRVIGDLEDDEERPDMQTSDVESILGLAIARNMPQRMLRWHYRSKHESLIAVSNREFYDNQLYVIPSPQRQGELGVKLSFVENGKFLKGKNEIEAKVVAQAILDHAKNKPNWTLGVAAFSVIQRDAIIQELEKLRQIDASCETFFDPNAPDPFFIKNLENVQGDERDAIFVSVGYGPGEDGKVALHFGPVSNVGGERRLNVLMTRAKSVLHIFSSMRAEDIDLSRATGRGPAVFREYLRFAQELNPPLDSPNRSDKEVRSQTTAAKPIAGDRLAEVLQRELTTHGYQVLTNMGIAGIYIDVAVLDPQNPERFILGIALDGPNYKSARSSRDRNRTYDGVLGAQGWSIYRIWSPEWFRNPQRQFKSLLETLEAAQTGQPPRKPNRLASPVSKIERRPTASNPLELAISEPEKLPPKPLRKSSTTRKSETKGGPANSKNTSSTIWTKVCRGCVALAGFVVAALKLVNSILTKLNQATKKSTRRSSTKKKR